MMDAEKIFRWMAKMQIKYSALIVVITLLITGFQIYGASRIHLETDFSKFRPPTEPAVMLNDRITNIFSGKDTIFLHIRLDPESTSSNAVKDIRDPRVIEMLIHLGDEISKEPSVDSVYSVGNGFKLNKLPKTLEESIEKFDKDKRSSGFFNRDYTATIANINANLGKGSEKIKPFLEEIEKDIASTPTPPGIKITVTGGPPIRTLVADILIRDAIKTILISSLLIFIVLIVIQKSLLKGILVFNPLAFALIWTIGTMGWLNIPLSLVTAGLGAMILGLGVEYSIFLVSKYESEHKAGKTQEDSIFTALQEVGSAIVGSSTTTIIGFLALLLSSMPMMHDLGTTLALGIFFCVISSLVINPAFIIFEEKYLSKIILKFISKELECETK